MPQMLINISLKSIYNLIVSTFPKITITLYHSDEMKFTPMIILNPLIPVLFSSKPLLSPGFSRNSNSETKALIP